MIDNVWYMPRSTWSVPLAPSMPSKRRGDLDGLLWRKAAREGRHQHEDDQHDTQVHARWGCTCLRLSLRMQVGSARIELAIFAV